MKRMMLSVLGLLAGFMVNAKEVEQISVVESEAVTVTVPFAVKSYAPSNKEVVRVEELGGTSLRVTALKKGRCDLDVMGDNGLHQKYEIQVVGDLASLLESLTQDLDSVPEVNAEIRGNFIRIDGEVNNIAKWEYLTKVLGNYGSTVKNYVKFYPGPETLNRLKDTLEQARFSVQFKRFEGDFLKWPYGIVALDLNKKTRKLSVQAHCINAAQRVSILSILKAEPWLAVNVEEDWKKPVDVPAEKKDYVIETLVALPIASPTNRPFAFVEHARKIEPPQFPFGAKVTCERIRQKNRKGQEKDAVRVSVPPVRANVRGRCFEMVFAAQGEKTPLPVRKVVMAEGFNQPLGSSRAKSPTSCVFAADELPPGRVTFTVTPRNCFGAEGSPLSVSMMRIFTTRKQP